jgi:hypothetical protein
MRPGVPEGFEALRTDGTTLIVAADRREPIQAAGLAIPENWQRLLGRYGSGAGRGGTARLGLADGTTAVLKQMRRGGAFAVLWRDRYAGTRRLLDNLRIPLEAVRRGVSTARPLAMLLVGGPPGFHRAWAAYEEIAQAPNLIEYLRSAEPPTTDEIDDVVGVVRKMHEEGIEHRDLNLGNLLLRRDDEAGSEAFVVDLDRGRLWDRPVPLRLRIRALCRLERSSVKLFGERPIDAFDLRRRWYEAYARDDLALAARLDRARRANHLKLGLHRLGWS